MGFRWQAGRQGTGYRKLLIAQGRRWDLYVLDYPSGTSITTHVGPVPGRRHWRANLVLVASKLSRATPCCGSAPSSSSDPT